MTEAVVADPQPERKVGFANRPYGNKKTVEEEEKELAVRFMSTMSGLIN